MPPLLHGRRPATVRPERRQPAAPPRQTIVAFEIHRQAAAIGAQDPSAGGASLLGMETVGDGYRHDVVGPVWSREIGPIGLLAQAPCSAPQSLPNGFAHAAVLLSVRGSFAGAVPNHRCSSDAR